MEYSKSETPIWFEIDVCITIPNSISHEWYSSKGDTRYGPIITTAFHQCEWLTFAIEAGEQDERLLHRDFQTVRTLHRTSLLDTDDRLVPLDLLRF